ncbi:hypothetical protein KY389_13630 [Paracoccus bogoriensis]|uniref:oligopeptide/dipeptide ABC transporter ATP-binding protein n=1 Tax=Paracoccus bogoriensis TaxID=242065 RepID=UPI001CA59B01|nr:oligopeptide/dipeptide ABC transporter ATP-binding protein [Paracoccus bogoriensis]MBW7057712.1 hypothetical protein [Paracoccus bogoriensis]
MGEITPSEALFATPCHPYMRMRLDAVPDIRMTGRRREKVESEIQIPSTRRRAVFFHTRRPIANDRCRSEIPALTPCGAQAAACHAGEE